MIDLNFKTTDLNKESKKTFKAFIDIFSNLNFLCKAEFNGLDKKRFKPTYLQVIYSHPFCILTDYIAKNIKQESSKTELSYPDEFLALANEDLFYADYIKSIDELLNPFMDNLHSLFKNEKTPKLYNTFCIKNIKNSDNQAGLNKILKTILDSYKKKQVAFNIKINNKDKNYQVIEEANHKWSDINKDLLYNQNQPEIFVFALEKLNQTINIDKIQYENKKDDSSQTYLLNLICASGNEIRFFNDNDKKSSQFYNRLFFV